MGKKQFCFFQTAETGNRTPDSAVKGSGANHYPRAPAQLEVVSRCRDLQLQVGENYSHLKKKDIQHVGMLVFNVLIKKSRISSVPVVKGLGN